MATPTQIIASVASLMNDSAQSLYTDSVVLPYLNIALNDLQELFELNNIPVTNEVSSVLAVTAGTTVIGAATSPALPTGLIEVRACYERETGTSNNFIEMVRKTFLPQVETLVNSFGVFAWYDQEIHVLEANIDIDLKLEYIKSIFSTPIVIGDVGVDLAITGSQQFLTFRTAALCSEFIGENQTRAQMLNQYAADALERALNIPTKGKQSIFVRRKPFRLGYKTQIRDGF